MEREPFRFTHEEPHIDYLAKDFASFRQLMLDHLSVLVPNWLEESPADIGHVLVETLAYAADYLSYYQDAVATEAYLDSARLRRSVRRHARLLDYFLHEGCNARVWVQVAIKEDTHLAKGTPLLTDLPGMPSVLDRVSYHELLTQSPLVFATLHDVNLFVAHNEIPLYAPNPRQEWLLPVGATSAWLLDEIDTRSTNTSNQSQKKLRKLRKLQIGDVLIFDEVLDPKNGKPRRDPKRRHAVRLTNVSTNVRPENEKSSDPIKPLLVKIEWSEADALPFALHIATYGKEQFPVSVAHGNIVLADQGRRISGEELPPVLPGVRYRPSLRLPGLTHRVPYRHDSALKTSATDTLFQDARQAMPDIRVYQQESVIQLATENAALLPAVIEIANIATAPQSSVHHEWKLRRDLLNSDRFARDFLIEMEENEQAFLRFGFGDMGKLPELGDEFVVEYRIGNGTRGNVGPDTIHHLVLDSDNVEKSAAAQIERVWNPLMAQSGIDPEPIEEVRIHAPYAFRVQKEQCIVEDDYAEMAKRYPGVLQATARIRYVGLWHTVVIYVRRHTFEPLSDEFRRRLDSFMQQYRQAGYEIDYRDPDFVPLHIAIQVHLKPGQRALILRGAIDNVVGTQQNNDGTFGFFHPATFAMGKPIYRSQLVAAIMQIAGVDRVDVYKFGRSDGADNVAEIPIGPLEIAELENDPAKPEHGTLKLEVIEAHE